MSCAFLNCGERCVRASGPERSSPGCPYSVLADGLHAMAQPLTVLRGALGAWKLRGSKAPESDRYLEMSAKQIERMTDLLKCMQDALDIADSEPKRARLNIGDLMELVLEEMRSDLCEWKGPVVRVGPADPVFLHGDKDRTERALRAALRALVSTAAPGETIWISVRGNERHVEVKAEQKAAHGKALGFTERLNLSLVEANIRSQGGGFEYSSDPLCIKFTLPAYILKATELAFTQDLVPAPVAN